MMTMIALGFVLWAGSWQAGPAQKVDVTGAWTVAITTADSQIDGLAIFSQDGTEVTGMIGPTETDMMPIAGTVSDNRLTLETRPRRGRTAAFAKCEVMVTRDRMSGTIDGQKGKIELVRRKRS